MTTHTITLPSGAEAEILMSVTAGDLIIAGLLIGLITLMTFSILKDLAHLSSKR